MIVPSIDISGGQAVQLIGGKKHAFNAGDPVQLAEKFGRVGELTVIDLDTTVSGRSTAEQCKSNAEQIRRLLPVAKCRVGGGIRDLQTAINWLDSGAAKVILDAATGIPECLPADRVVAALDARQEFPSGIIDQINELRGCVGGFLITFVGHDGQTTAMDINMVGQCVRAAGNTRVTVAGGVTTTREIAQLDAMGVDAQIGAALYTNRISLAEGFCSPLTSDRADRLWPTIVSNEPGQALGLVYSNPESVNCSLETGLAHYWSRKRGLWKKGETSGATQELLAIDMDCDRDALRFTVRQNGSGFCHLPQTTCFGNLPGIERLQRQLFDRLNSAPEGSYTQQLFQSPELLNLKLLEEANELVTAISSAEVVHEAADVIFFTLARMVKEGIPWSEVENELDRRSLKVTRRASKVEAGGSSVNV